MLVPGASGTVGTGSTTVTPGLPAGLVNGQVVFKFVVTKPDTATIGTPTNWTSRANRAGGGGTTGVDTGPTRAAVFTRIKDASWSTMSAVSVTSGNSSAALAAPYLPAAGSGSDIATVDGEYTGNGTAWSVTFGTDPGVQEGDRLIVFCSNQSDGPTWSAQSLSVPGCVLSPVWERSEAIEGTTGNDVGGMVCEFHVRSGTSTGAATFTATTSAASRGVTILIRVRETSVPANLIDGVEPEAGCGFVGPLMDGNGNLYRLTEEYLGANVAMPEFGNHPMIEKSTNGGVTWKRMDSINGPGYGQQGAFNDMESAWLVQRATKQSLVVLWEKGSSRWWGAVYRTSDHPTNPDTWDTGSIGTSSGVETFATTIAAESGIAGVSLSDGTVRAFIRGTVQGGFESFAHRVMAASGTTWDLSPGYITDGRNITRPSPVVADNDTTYLFYRDDTNGQVRYRTISSTGTVSASVRVDSGGAGAAADANYVNNVVPPVYYNDNGTPVVVVGFVNASNKLRTVEIRGGVVGSEQEVSADVLTVNPPDLAGSSTDSQGPSAALAVIGTTLYAFWGEVIGTSGDVYYATRPNGGSWSARQLFYDTGSGRECQWLYAKAISSTKIAVSTDIGRHFDDDSNIFYSELTVSSGSAGSATGSITLGGSSTGQTTRRGSSSGSMTLGGTSTGSTVRQGSSSGALTLSGTATGSILKSGAASGSIILSGTATGSRPTQGSATGSLTLSGSSTGVEEPKGSASGSLTLSGTSTGSVVRLGSATGSVTLSGSSTGTTTRSGSSVGSVTLSGSSTGAIVRSGSSTGSVTLSGSSTGEKNTSGTSEGSLSLSGSATGQTTRSGASSGSVTLSGSATGTAPSVEGSEGAAAGSVSLEGSASGQVNRFGSSAGVLTLSGSSQGSTFTEGDASGSVSLDGSTSGSAPLGGASTGGLQLGGSSAGETLRVGASVGVLTLDGGAFGSSDTGNFSFGAITLGGTVQGKQFPNGAAASDADDLQLDGSATGQLDRRGSATGSITLGGSAVAQSSGLRDITVSGRVLPRIINGNVVIETVPYGKVLPRTYNGGVLNA